MKMSSKMPNGGMGTMDYRNFKKKAYGGLAEAADEIEKASYNSEDYDGNTKESKEFEKEVDTQNFAKGGMAKKKIVAAHEKAKAMMPEMKKEYGEKKGEAIAYATGMKQVKEGMADGGYMAEGGKAKPAVMAIVARLKKGAESPVAEEPTEIGEGESEEAGEMEGHSVAADEIMSAIKSGDREGLVSALKNFYEMCKMRE